MSNFDYEIQGVKLTDPRGAWYLLPGTDTLPKYPGLRVTRFNIPGASGEKQVQHAPLEPVPYLFRVRFNAIDVATGQMGKSFDEKTALLERNINEFMFTTRLGAQSHLGNVELKRINPVSQTTSTDYIRYSNGVLYAAGRVVATSAPEIAESREYADYEFVYENLTGVWYSEWTYRNIGLKQTSTRGIWVHCGTAPIDDALIAIKPVGRDMPSGLLVRNEAGIGFEVKKVLTQNRWHIFDTYNWAAGNSNGIWWSGPKPDKTSMTEYGRPVGSALVITPGISGASTPRGLVTIRLRSPAEIRVATRSKWF